MEINTPLSDTEVIQKFQMLATPVLGAERTQGVINRVMSIEHLMNPHDLFALL